MREHKAKIELSERERSILIELLVEARNQFLEKNLPIDDVNELIKKAGRAKETKEIIEDRDER